MHWIEAYIRLGLIFVVIISILYLPILFKLKKKGISPTRQVSYIGLVCSIFLIVFATMLFMLISFDSTHTLNIIPFNWNEIRLYQFVVEKIPNILLFIPFGFVISRTVKILYFGIWLVEMITEITPTVGTNKQAWKHIFFAVRFLFFACFPVSSFLYRFPYTSVNNRLVNIFENNKVFLVIYYASFVFVRFWIGFEIYQVAAVFLFFQHFNNYRRTPIIRIRHWFFTAPVDTLA